MAEEHKKLKKELSLLNVYAIATGTTLSTGFFLIPGLAFAEAGPAVILCYFIAAIPLIPALLSKLELATAMPRAGGTYYFLDRSLGPLVGTIGGLGTWLTLVLKSAFALIGMGAYLNIFIPGNYIIPIAIGFAIIFGLINLKGAKESGFFQIALVAGLLVLLAGFCINGTFYVQFDHFKGFFDTGAHSIFSTAGLVYISYIGITKVASVSEEVKDPERNLPLGMFLALGTSLVIYAIGTYVMVGVLPAEQLSGSLIPVAATAEHMVGTVGSVLVTAAAILAFSSGTNAGILSASRYPLAMSRDHLISDKFKKLSKHQIPYHGVIATVVAMLFVILFLNPIKIAKLASAFQLLMFALCCLGVIIMRESKIEEYDPGFKSPLYPWMQLFGIVTSFWLIFQMGWLSIIFTFGLIAIGAAWYFYYAESKVNRSGAILNVFQRLGKQKHEGLEHELRGILKEKGLRAEDPFTELIARAQVIEYEKSERFDNIIQMASKIFAANLSYPQEKIEHEFLEGTKVGATPVSNGVALPHMRLHHLVEPELIIINAKKGVEINISDEFWGDHKPDGEIFAIFFLVSPEENPQQHLRILAKIAGRVDDESFINEWRQAQSDDDLREVILRDEIFFVLRVETNRKSSKLIDKMIKDLELPEGTLIAMIRRAGKMVVPKGNTELQKGDKLTIIGDHNGIEEIRKLYG